MLQDTLRDKCDPSSDCLQNCCISPVIAPLYFVIFVLMAQFVLVNVVVAVLMKHLEESHNQLKEDEDHDIDMEIAKEIEAERNALLEAIERRQREKELKVRRPLMKMASLPSNFTFSNLSTSFSATWQGATSTEDVKKSSNKADNAGRRNSARPDGTKSKGNRKGQKQVKNSASCYNAISIEENVKPADSNNLQAGVLLKKSHSLRIRPSKSFLSEEASFYSGSPNLVVTKPGGDLDDNSDTSQTITPSSSNDLQSKPRRRSRDNCAGTNSTSRSTASGRNSFKGPRGTASNLSLQRGASVTINIERCSTEDEEESGGASAQPTQSTTPTPVATTTTASPSRVTVVSNGLRHRKLSDFLDEESAPLSPGVLVSYPEFSTDSTCDEEDLRVLDEEEDDRNKEEMSLASAESWPSTELTTDTTASNFLSDASRQSNP